jgi:hypothetical protein
MEVFARIHTQLNAGPGDLSGPKAALGPSLHMVQR